ncbi:putative receptor-like protein kinase, partial [Tanacetum coccineum]
MVSNAVGTSGYCDPLYREIGLHTKESDVYSFGVYCLKLCGYRNGELTEILVPKWRHRYDQKSCEKSREERPTLDKIVKELEFEIFENLKKKVNIMELMIIADLAVPPLSYGSNSHFLLLLLEGFFVDDGTR